MLQRAIPVTLLLVCAGVPALGADLELSASGDVEYDDNVFRSERERDKEDDVLFRLRPALRVYEDRGDDLNYSLGYTLPVEFSVENSDELDEVDHVFNGSFVYHVSNRVQIFGNDRYGYLRSTLRSQGVDVESIAAAQPLADFPALTEERDRVKINDALLGASYLFSPRLVGRVSATSDFFDSTRSDRARNYSVGGGVSAAYTLTSKHQIGAGGGYTFQEFEDRDTIAGSETNIYRLYGTWRWTLTETMSFEVQAGPSYLETDQQNARRVRLESSIPFVVSGATTVTGGGIIDDDGNSLPPGTPIAAGSLLLPSLNPQGTNNCARIDDRTVAAGCFFNVVLDPSDDAAAIAQILNNPVSVTNLNPRGARDRNVNFFADVVLTKRWMPTLATAVRYTRTQSNASGLGGTVILDAVSVANTWDFRDRWQLAVRGDWTRRDSAFDLEQTFDVVTGEQIPGGNPNVPVATRDGNAFNAKNTADIDTDRWGVAGRITHQLFRSTSLYGQVRYDEQMSRSGTLGTTSDFDVLLATFGVRHVFEPIKLW